MLAAMGAVRNGWGRLRHGCLENAGLVFSVHFGRLRVPFVYVYAVRSVVRGIHYGCSRVESMLRVRARRTMSTVRDDEASVARHCHCGDDTVAETGCSVAPMCGMRGCRCPVRSGASCVAHGPRADMVILLPDGIASPSGRVTSRHCIVCRVVIVCSAGRRRSLFSFWPRCE